MSEQRQSSPELGSWKEIADHLGVAVRTAQKWERDKALPVRRMPGEKGRVSAGAAQLDHWKRTALHEGRWWSRPDHLRTYAVLSSLLALGLALHEFTYHRGSSHAQAPTSFRVEWQSLIVRDQRGNPLWTKTFAETLEAGAYSNGSLGLHRKIAFDDIDRDRAQETLFIYAPVNSARSPSALYCFSGAGGERWRFVPEASGPRDREGDGATHVLNDLLVTASDEGSEARILLLDCRLPKHAATLFVLSPGGKVLATYSHLGHMGMLEAADVDHCGSREILIGGFDAEHQQAELTVLAFPNGRADGGGDFDGADGVEPGPAILEEKAVLAFPRTCLNQKLEESNRIVRIAYTGEVLTVGVAELSTEEGVEVVYRLDGNLRVQGAWFSDSLRNLHRALHAQGVLDHELTPEEMDSFKNVSRLEPHGPRRQAVASRR